LPELGIEPRTSCTQSGCVTIAPPSQLRVSIVFKPFNYLDAMGRNENKQHHICGPNIFNKYIFSVLFLDAWMTMYLAVSHIYESRFRCLTMVKMLDVNNIGLKDTGIASLKWTCLHCLQHSFIEHLFNLYSTTDPRPAIRAYSFSMSATFPGFPDS